MPAYTSWQWDSRSEAFCIGGQTPGSSPDILGCAAEIPTQTLSVASSADRDRRGDFSSQEEIAYPFLAPYSYLDSDSGRIAGELFGQHLPTALTINLQSLV